MGANKRKSKHDWLMLHCTLFGICKFQSAEMFSQKGNYRDTTKTNQTNKQTKTSIQQKYTKR
jgi:hypothetical protein